MPVEIRVPRLGWSMEEGTFVRWLKQAGEQVAVGEPLFELEGEKAAQEIEATDAGTLHILPNAPWPGSTVTIGTLLGFLLAPGEAISSSGPLSPFREGEGERASDSQDTPRETCSATEDQSHGRRRGNTTPSPYPRPPQRGDRGPDQRIATPRAKRVAAELGINWTTLKGTGRDGRIREADVLVASASHTLSPRRRTIAERLRQSHDRMVQVTLTMAADADRLVEAREQFKSPRTDLVPSYTDLVASLVARVLMQHPQLAVRWDGRQESLVPTSPTEVHIGIAVHTDAGLLVPVIRNVLNKPLLDIARQSRVLIDRARSGQLTASEMTGGVLTITNLGAYGIEAFTPVINFPEIAILGLGAIRREPVVTPAGEIAIGNRITLSLTFDHAAVDGAPAAAFLRDIAAAIGAADLPL